MRNRRKIIKFIKDSPYFDDVNYKEKIIYKKGLVEFSLG